MEWREPELPASSARCDIPIVDAAHLNASVLSAYYSEPLLVRGGANSWPALRRWRRSCAALCPSPRLASMLLSAALAAWSAAAAARRAAAEQRAHACRRCLCDGATRGRAGKKSQNPSYLASMLREKSRHAQP